MSDVVWDRYPKNPSMELLRTVSKELDKHKIKPIPCTTCGREFFVIDAPDLDSEDVNISGKYFIVNPDVRPDLQNPLTCEMHDDLLIQEF